MAARNEFHLKNPFEDCNSSDENQEHLETIEEPCIKFFVNNEKNDHPVFKAEPKSLDPSRVTGSDAFLIKQRKRDQKSRLKLFKQVSQTIRLKIPVSEKSEKAQAFGEVL